MMDLSLNQPTHSGVGLIKDSRAMDKWWFAGLGAQVLIHSGAGEKRMGNTQALLRQK